MIFFKCFIYSFIFLFPIFSIAKCIGVITAGGGATYWGEVTNGAKDVAKVYKYSIYSRGTTEVSKEKSQLYIIKDVIRMGCIGIVLAPTAGKELIEKVNELRRRGIPIAIIDRDLYKGHTLGAIKTDHFKAGYTAGKRLSEKLTVDHAVAILTEGKNIAPVSYRVQGFIKALTEKGIKIKANKDIGTSMGTAREKSRLLLQSDSFKNISAVFTPNELTTTATLITMRELKMNKDVLHVGFDLTPTIKEAIKKGEIYGVIAQDAYQIGFQGTKRVINALHGKSDNKKIKIPVKFITKSNL